MDQLKVGLDALKRYNFWVLLVVLIAVGCGSWFMATGEIAEQFASRKNKLDSTFNNMRNISNKDDLPNLDRIDFIKGKHKELNANVYAAWEDLKKLQEDKNALPTPLSAGFKKHFKQLGADGTIPRSYREEYQLFILDHFPALFEDIRILRPDFEDAKKAGGAKKADATYGAFGDRGDQEEVKMVGVIDWDGGDQERVKQRFFWEEVPDTDQVVLAQEDLWVYEALLRAIKATNGNAKEQYNAPITHITALEIGADASESLMASAQPIMLGASGSQGTPEQAAGEEGGEEGGEAGQPELQSGEYGYKGAEAGADNLLQYRYVGRTGRPLAADAKQPYAEFKMMPIRMSLVMDQTMVPALLVACANSNMPIEIRKVRLDPGKKSDFQLTAKSNTGETQDRGIVGGTAAARSAYGGMTGGGLHEGAAYSGGRGGYRRYSSGSAGKEEFQSGDHPLHMPVELQGIIYIFNPPNVEKLGTGSASEEQPQTPVETPPSEEPSTETPPAEEPPAETPPAGTPPAGEPTESVPPGTAPAAPETETPETATPETAPADGATNNDTTPAKAAAGDGPAETP